MSRELITIDIDDVVADSTEAFRIEVNNHTGASLTPEDYRVPLASYNDYYEHVWQRHGLTVVPDEISTNMQIDQSHIELIDGADVALRALAKKYNIAFITSRPVAWEDATHLYLGQKLKGLSADIHFTEHREGVTKGDVCRELGAKWHVDDNPDHCESVIERGVGGILFGEYGWHYKLPAKAVHCKDWAEVLEFFDGRS